MKWPFRIKTPVCPSCGSSDTTTGRIIRLAAGLALGIGVSMILYLIGYIYPLGRILIPFTFIGGMIICVIPPLGKYCCLECDAYWNPDNPSLVWRTKPPGL
ncbi:hypothetical protein SAMN05660649_01977 [Desulfotomaculum arcticum]|uniref:Uncharacterized protein n=1 Tax=Desulfotruncus arcticus DSM 17038 TaxID=1121424 RepID=A0A1I2SSI6_9FIRM|nr:hypothetical protein [Desulfotruncus arcticus]SFG55662.1 hypothetical protein SAMN05660649_01977 [Desulfotomaculum arcticum] [Desulfotruncus arcticus DSM 17038]